MAVHSATPASGSHLRRRLSPVTALRPVGPPARSWSAARADFASGAGPGRALPPDLAPAMSRRTAPDRREREGPNGRRRRPGDTDEAFRLFSDRPSLSRSGGDVDRQWRLPMGRPEPGLAFAMDSMTSDGWRLDWARRILTTDAELSVRGVQRATRFAPAHRPERAEGFNVVP